MQTLRAFPFSPLKTHEAAGGRFIMVPWQVGTVQYVVSFFFFFHFRPKIVLLQCASRTVLDLRVSDEFANYARPKVWFRFGILAFLARENYGG